MKLIQVQCQSISPILMNPMTEDILDELYGGASARKPRNSDKKQEDVAKEKVIRNESGAVGLPIEYLFSCLVEAGRFVQYDGKRKVSNADSTLIPSFMSLQEMFLPFLDQDTPWHVDKRRGRLQNGTAVCIIRPRFDTWAFNVTVEFDEGEINEGKVKELFRRAGTAIGLADFRPSCRGPFGRFEVKKWEVTEMPVDKAA